MCAAPPPSVAGGYTSLAEHVLPEKRQELDRDSVLRKLVFLFFVFQVMMAVDSVSMPGLLLRFCDGDEGRAGLVQAEGGMIYFGSAFLSLGLWSAASERFGRRPVILACFCAEFLGHLLLVTRPRIETYLLSQCSFATLLPAVYASATDVDAEQSSFAKFALALGAAFALGPLLGALLFSVDWWLPFVATLSLCGIGALATSFSLPETVHYRRLKGTPLGTIKAFSSSNNSGTLSSFLSLHHETSSNGPNSQHRKRRWIFESDVSPLRSLVIVTRAAPSIRRLLIPYAFYQTAASSTGLCLYYLDYRFHASLIFVGALFSTLGLSFAIFYGLGLNSYLSQKTGVLLGTAGQILLLAILVAAPSKLYVFALLIAFPAYGLQEPFIRADLATRLPDDAQEALNAALFSLRALTHGTAHFFFSYLFLLGTKSRNKASLPFNVAMAFGLLAILLFTRAFYKDLRKLSRKKRNNSFGSLVAGEQPLELELTDNSNKHFTAPLL